MDQAAIEELVSVQKHQHALSRDFYTDQDIYNRDVERIFLHSWLYAGHVSEIPKLGDWFLFNFAGESLIIVRSDETTIDALVNVCRHRGSRIRTEKSGCSRRLTCPYHGWTYALDGRLLVAAHMREDFDKSDISLRKVRLEVFEGMIFINFDENAASFDPVRENLVDCLKPYDLANAKVAHRESFPIDANWKLAVENYSECYHCSPSHPEYAQGHSLSKPSAQSSELYDEMHAKAESCGLGTKEVHRVYLDAPDFGADYAYERYPLWNDHVTGSKDGKPVSPLLGDIRDYDGGTTDLNFGPVTFGLAYCDHVVLYRFTPLSIDRTDCDITWLVRGDAEEGKDFSKEKLTWLWDVTTQADKRIIENNAKGVNSKFYVPGPLSKMEDYCGDFLEWYLHTIKQDDWTPARSNIREDKAA
jgi:phenylpropionate dioxygenase-like ring-hydroxylating dioxygenase large terminal subunit